MRSLYSRHTWVFQLTAVHTLVTQSSLNPVHAGEDLVPEPQNEVEELQGEGERVHAAARGATGALEPIRTRGYDTRDTCDTHSPVHETRALQRGFIMTHTSSSLQRLLVLNMDILQVR